MSFVAYNDSCFLSLSFNVSTSGPKTFLNLWKDYPSLHGNHLYSQYNSTRCFSNVVHLVMGLLSFLVNTVRTCSLCLAFSSMCSVPRSKTLSPLAFTFICFSPACQNSSVWTKEFLSYFHGLFSLKGQLWLFWSNIDSIKIWETTHQYTSQLNHDVFFKHVLFLLSIIFYLSWRDRLTHPLH